MMNSNEPGPSFPRSPALVAPAASAVGRRHPLPTAPCGRRRSMAAGYISMASPTWTEPPPDSTGHPLAIATASSRLAASRML